MSTEYPEVDDNSDYVDAETFVEPDQPLAEERHDIKSSESSRRSSKEKKSDPPGKESHPKKRACPIYYGVKSYLDQFYDTAYFKDPYLYEDDDFRYLLHPNPRRRRCPPLLWKVSVWVGVNLLLFGIIGILVGYLVYPKPILDEAALRFNATLDVCKLIGLILFCLGGLTLTLALLLPSFLTNYCEDDITDESVRVHLGEEEKAPLSPIEMKIPASSKVRNVQPYRTETEAMMTQEGTLVMKD